MIGPIVSLIRRLDFSRIHVSQHLDLRDNKAAVYLVFDLVKDFFMQRAIPITEIQFWGRLVVIVLEGKEDTSILGTGSLPQSVAQCNCFYLFEEEMSRPGSLSAFQHVEFRKKPLKNTVIPGPPSEFNGLSWAAETKLGDSIFLDSPFSGFLEGTTLSHATLRVPTSANPSSPQQSAWIRCQWHDMGQGSSRAMSDKICGSPILSKEHKVQALFRYAPTLGVFMDSCLSVAADELFSDGE